MVAVTICSDFGAQKSKVSHCFHCFPIYLPGSDGTGSHDLSFLNAELCFFFFLMFFEYCFKPAFLTQVIALIQILNLRELFQQPNTLLEQSD